MKPLKEEDLRKKIGKIVNEVGARCRQDAADKAIEQLLVLFKKEKKEALRRVRLKRISWNKKERLKFSTNEVDAIKYEIAFNSAVDKLDSNIKEELK